MASLAEWRHRRGPYSRLELAQRAGVAEATVDMIERGRRTKPRARIVRSLCAALGVEPAEVDEFRAWVSEAETTERPEG